MPVLRATRLRCVVAGCCLLLVAGAGCQLQRTGRGLVVQSRHWSLAYDRDGFASDESGASAPKSDLATAKSRSAGPTASNSALASRPELLPWRNRARRPRLAERIFNRAESAESKGALQVGAEESGLAQGMRTDKIIFPPPPDVDFSPTQTAAREKPKKHPALDERVKPLDNTASQPVRL